MLSPEYILEIDNLSVDFDDGTPRQHSALKSADLKIARGSTVGLVGGSGSGKTVLAHSILGLLPKNSRYASGKIEYCGRDILGMSEAGLQAVRGKEIAMIFQDPQVSLNPVFRIGRQLEWVLKLHRDLAEKEAKEEALQLLESVKLSDPKRCFGSFPHQFSGGMCQRVMIAMALACAPKLLIADEPTSALDVTTQAEILSLLSEINQATSMALLLISHDIGAVAALCDNVSVINEGVMIESGPVKTVFESPKHQYTQSLIDASCRTDIFMGLERSASCVHRKKTNFEHQEIS